MIHDLVLPPRDLDLAAGAMSSMMEVTMTMSMVSPGGQDQVSLAFARRPRNLKVTSTDVSVREQFNRRGEYLHPEAERAVQGMGWVLGTRTLL